MEYWSRKMELATAAREHTEDMRSRFGQEIDACIKASIIFGGDGKNPSDAVPGKQALDASFMMNDTVSALFEQPEDCHVVLLNFASYKFPGGQFMNGSSAQEESLCHSSFLFNVLDAFSGSYYEWNKQNLNRGLYKNRAILSPNVRFFKDGKERLADVLTCAAPNRSIIRYGRFEEEDNSSALYSRIDFISKVLRQKGYAPDAIILGAFGCGVFAQNAEDVAGLFRTSQFPASARIVYAVPDNRNYKLSYKAFHPYP